MFAHFSGAPLSKNAMTNALKRLGYDTGNQHCAHGFRSMASTLLNEWGGWSKDAVERQLAHGDEDKIRGTYNKAEMWDERVRGRCNIGPTNWSGCATATS